MSSIDADKWDETELRKVISGGEGLLNVKFSEDFINELLANSFGSVYIVQETCYQCCKKYNVSDTQQQKKVIGNKEDADDLVDSVVEQQTGRFNAFITHFADGFQATSLEMFKWLLYPILTADIESLRSGLKYSDIRTALSIVHPQKVELNPGNLTQALQSCAALQVKKELKPLIIDYDQTNRRLRVVDSGFLIWINKQDRNELLDLAGLPPMEQAG